MWSYYLKPHGPCIPDVDVDEPGMALWHENKYPPEKRYALRRLFVIVKIKKIFLIFLLALHSSPKHCLKKKGKKIYANFNRFWLTTSPHGSQPSSNRGESPIRRRDMVLPLQENVFLPSGVPHQ